MKKNKNMLFIVIGVLAVVLIAAAVASWGRQYYEDRYISSDYYAMVPLDFDAQPDTLYSDNGEDVGPGKIYNLTAFSADGESRPLKFTVHSLGSGFVGERELFKPGAYLLIQASKQIVTGYREIDRTQVPAGLLDKIESGKVCGSDIERL